MLSLVAALLVFVVLAVGAAWVQLQRARRVPEPTPPPPGPLGPPPDEPDPDIAARLLALDTSPPAIPALLGEPSFDLPGFLEVLRSAFERVVQGAAPDTLTVSAAVAAAPNGRGPMVALATRPPRLSSAFADDRGMTVHASFEALVQVDTPVPRRWVEEWSLKRARGAERWELAQVLNGQLCSLGDPSQEAGMRSAPLPDGEPVDLDALMPALMQAEALLRGEDASTPDLQPAFAAELRFRAALAAAQGRAKPAEAILTDARKSTTRIEGAHELHSVWVDGYTPAGKFRERWILIDERLVGAEAR